jgi:hypothetical protein
MDQTWYADDAGAGGFDAIKRHFEKLEEIGPNYGYFRAFEEHPYRASQNAFEHRKFWIPRKVINGCGRGGLPGCRKHRDTYTALQKSLQQEWQFVRESWISVMLSPTLRAISQSFLQLSLVISTRTTLALV